MGLEAAGIVLRVGAQVQGLSPGDRIATFGPGAFATTMILPESRCIKIPDCLTLEDAAVMPLAFATALHGLCDLGNLQKNQVIVPLPLIDAPLTGRADCSYPFCLRWSRPCCYPNQ